MSKIVFDIDGTICSRSVDNNYKIAKPYKGMISIINKLYDDGNHIIFYTSRGVSSGIDWKGFTEKQLKKWGCKYHELLFNKLSYDLWIDDKAHNASSFELEFYTST